MLSLPQASNLPVEFLAACFKDVTNSYKFYWLLAILENIRSNQSPLIATSDLLGSMLASIWYPTNYFRLSFGKEDRLGKIVQQIGESANVPMDANRQHVIKMVKEKVSENSEIADEVMSLARYVPYRFLRPFFDNQLKAVKDAVVNKMIEQLASESFYNSGAPCLYRFIRQPFNGIEIHQDWFAYLKQHLTILTSFCLWHLVNYVQKNNPNIPNICNKLFEPQQRDLKNARIFWKLVFEQLGSLTCIYSGQVMNNNNYSLDHFLPWRFVAHDLLWNIVPTLGNINSSKSDNLPNLEKYFSSFSQLQYQALQVVASSSRNKLLEDHLLLLRVGSTEELQLLTYEKFQEVLRGTMAPQFQIATNMGFTSNWSYQIL